VPIAESETDYTIVCVWCLRLHDLQELFAPYMPRTDSDDKYVLSCEPNAVVPLLEKHFAFVLQVGLTMG
jgi:hypothetical protein